MSNCEYEQDDTNVICPYCKHEYQPEAEDYSEDERIEECDECGKKYTISQSFSVTHHSEPDCEINGLEHDWRPRDLRSGRTHDFCEECGQCRPVQFKSDL